VAGYGSAVYEPHLSRDNPDLGRRVLTNMVDIDLIVKELRDHGHTVEDLHHVAPDAGEFEMIIDGTVVNLEGARGVLEMDAEKRRR